MQGRRENILHGKAIYKGARLCTRYIGRYIVINIYMAFLSTPAFRDCWGGGGGHKAPGG